MNQQPQASNRPLDQLRAIDFAIQETVLYLDAYPDCREALDYYHKLIAERKQICADYRQMGGNPLTVLDNQSRDSWDWINGPMPWEPEANE